MKTTKFATACIFTLFVTTSATALEAAKPTRPAQAKGVVVHAGAGVEMSETNPEEGARQCQDNERFVATLALPSGQTLVVAEGDLEARSLGSFSARLYAAAPPGDQTTFYTTGLVLPRDGAVESLSMANVTGDTNSEIIVSIRSAGSGNYLSAYALSYDVDGLEVRAHVEGIAKDEDVIRELR